MAVIPVEAAGGAPVAAPAPKRPRVIGWVLLATWSALALWAGHRLAHAWPYVGLMPQWVLLLALPGVAFRTADLAWMRMRGRHSAGWRRALLRAAAIVVGAWTAVSAWAWLDAASLARFERAMLPLVARVQADPDGTCRSGPAAAVAPGAAAYLEQADAPRSAAELHWDRQRFVLALPGRSMDIDGSTLYFDSRDGRWRKVHNDTLQRTGELTTLATGLASCRFPLR